MNRAIGPNEPCPCGSGKKFKKCHMGAKVPVAVGAVSGHSNGESGGSGIGAFSAPELGRRLLNLGGRGSGIHVGGPKRRVTPAPISPTRAVPDYIAKPEYALTGEPDERKGRFPLVKNRDTLARMRSTCAKAREVLDIVLASVRPGISTDELDAICHEETLRRGAYPSPLNYSNFPKSLCTSVNEVVCHGIPSGFVIEDGDIVNCDVTIYLDGVHGDTNETVFVGEVDAESRKLVEDTYEAMLIGIGTVRPGGRIRDIGREIEKFARARRYGVVTQFCGHGIGERFHMEPQVSHAYDPSAQMEMRPGMTFTIEPMINLGTHRCDVWDDEWTAVTADLKRSAQFEQTVLVTTDGVEILTANGGKPMFMRQMQR